jgi:hypothetical protein
MSANRLPAAGAISHVHMVRHDHPGEQFIARPGAMQQHRLDDARERWIAEEARAVTGVATTTSRGAAPASRKVIACMTSGESRCGSARGTCLPLCSRSAGAAPFLEGRRPAARVMRETRTLLEKSFRPRHVAAFAARIAARAHCSQNGVPCFAAARSTAIWRSSSSKSFWTSAGERTWVRYGAGAGSDRAGAGGREGQQALRQSALPDRARERDRARPVRQAQAE